MILSLLLTQALAAAPNCKFVVRNPSSSPESEVLSPSWDTNRRQWVFQPTILPKGCKGHAMISQTEPNSLDSLYFGFTCGSKSQYIEVKDMGLKTMREVFTQYLEIVPSEEPSVLVSLTCGK